MSTMFKKSTHEPAAFIRHSSNVYQLRYPIEFRNGTGTMDNKMKGIHDIRRNLLFLMGSVVKTNPNTPFMPQNVCSDFAKLGIKIA